MQNISQETVRSLGVPVLSLAEQRRRVDQFEHLSAHVSHGIELCHASIDRLKEYRSALITAAVTGQIDVGAAARLGAADRRLDALHREMDA